MTPPSNGRRRTKFDAEQLPAMRQKALQQALVMMGCDHLEGEDCEHVQAATDIFTTGVLTMAVEVVAKWGDQLTASARQAVLNPDLEVQLSDKPKGQARRRTAARRRGVLRPSPEDRLRQAVGAGTAPAKGKRR